MGVNRTITIFNHSTIHSNFQPACVYTNSFVLAIGILGQETFSFARPLSLNFCMELLAEHL